MPFRGYRRLHFNCCCCSFFNVLALLIYDLFISPNSCRKFWSRRIVMVLIARKLKLLLEVTVPFPKLNKTFSKSSKGATFWATYNITNYLPCNLSSKRAYLDSSAFKWRWQIWWLTPQPTTRPQSHNNWHDINIIYQFEPEQKHHHIIAYVFFCMPVPCIMHPLSLLYNSVSLARQSPCLIRALSDPLI